MPISADVAAYGCDAVIPPNILSMPEDDFRRVLSQASDAEMWQLYGEYPPTTRHAPDPTNERRFAILGECARRGFWDTVQR